MKVHQALVIMLIDLKLSPRIPQYDGCFVVAYNIECKHLEIRTLQSILTCMRNSPW